MQFYDERGRLVNHKKIEVTEQKRAGTYIPADAVVLELGARYGTVTCAISKKLQNKQALVTVEPDERVWEALEKNIARNGCFAHIVKGFISKQSLTLTNLDNYHGGYGATAIVSENSTTPRYTLEEIESKYDLRFNTLVADCEGFLEMFFDENPTFIDQLRLILFEKDYPKKCNYAKIETLLRNKGFRRIVGGFQSVWQK